MKDFFSITVEAFREYSPPAHVVFLYLLALIVLSRIDLSAWEHTVVVIAAIASFFADMFANLSKIYDERLRQIRDEKGPG